MKELEELTTFEQAVLLATCNANLYKIAMHVPFQAIAKRIKKVSHKLIKKALNTLVKNAFVIKHPTRRNITFQLSKKGISACNQIQSNL